MPAPDWTMDFEQRHLEMAERHVREGELRIARLEHLIERVSSNPMLRFTGEKLLTEFKISLQSQRARRELIRRQVAAAEETRLAARQKLRQSLRVISGAAKTE
jgi:hypothetical protein